MITQNVARLNSNINHELGLILMCLVGLLVVTDGALWWEIVMTGWRKRKLWELCIPCIFDVNLK